MNTVTITLPEPPKGKKWAECTYQEWCIEDYNSSFVTGHHTYCKCGCTTFYHLVDETPGYPIPDDFAGFIGEGWVRDYDDEKWIKVFSLNAVHRSIKGFKFIDDIPWEQARSAKPVLPYGHIIESETIPGSRVGDVKVDKYAFVWFRRNGKWILSFVETTNLEAFSSENTRIADDVIGYVPTLPATKAGA